MSPPSLNGLHTSGFQLFESGNNEAGTSDDSVKTAPVNAVTVRLSLWPAGLEEGRGTAGRAGRRCQPESRKGLARADGASSQEQGIGFSTRHSRWQPVSLSAAAAVLLSH